MNTKHAKIPPITLPIEAAHISFQSKKLSKNCSFIRLKINVSVIPIIMPTHQKGENMEVIQPPTKKCNTLSVPNFSIILFTNFIFLNYIPIKIKSQVYLNLY